MYSITSKCVHQYTCINSTKIEKSLPQPQRDVHQIAVCFMFSVFESQLPLFVIVWFEMCCIQQQPMIFKVDMRSFSQSYHPTATCLLYVILYLVRLCKPQLCNFTILSYQGIRIVVILVRKNSQLIAKIAGQQSTLFYFWTSRSQGNTSVHDNPIQRTKRSSDFR